MKQLPEPVQQSLAARSRSPHLGKPEEFAQLACHIVTNSTSYVDVRMAPR